jgi:hypothetical protein
MGGVQIVDVNTPTEPIILGSYDTPGLTWSVDVVGNRAYVADSRSGMHILDVSDPTTPTLLGSYTDVGAITGVQVANSIAYVSDYFQGLLVLDVSNPAAPVLIGSYDIPQESWNLQLVDNLVYMTHYVADPPSDPDEPSPPPNDELHIIDVSNPRAPAVAGIYTGLDAAVNLFVADRLVYVSQMTASVEIVDVRDPSNPFRTSSISVPSYDLVVQQGRAYIAVSLFGFGIFDVQQPTAPVLRGEYNMSPGMVNDLQVANDNTFIAGGYHGMSIIDQQNNLIASFPMNLSLSTNISFVEDIAVVGTTAYVALWQSITNPEDFSTSHSVLLHIYDISNTARPELLGMYAVDDVLLPQLNVVGSIAYVLLLNPDIVEYELYILDVSNPTEPQLLNILFGINDMHIDQSTAYLMNDTGLTLLDMSNPVSPTIRAEITELYGYRYSDIVVQDGKAYLSDSGSISFLIIDANPSSTTFGHPLGEYLGKPIDDSIFEHTNLRVRDIIVSNDNTMVYIVLSQFAIDVTTATLLVVDVSQPSQPVLQATYTVEDVKPSLVQLDCSDPYLYIATGTNRLDIFDVSDPTRPQLTASHQPSLSPLYSSVDGLALINNRVFLAAGLKGFEILDISNPADPVYIGGQTKTTIGSAYSVKVAGDTAYLIGSALNIIDVQQPSEPYLLAEYATFSSSLEDVVVQDSLLYSAEGEYGLRILDISTPTHPNIIGQYDTAGETYGVTVEDNIAYVADGSAGLLLLDVADPTTIERLGNYDTPGLVASVQVRDKIAYTIVDAEQVDDGTTGMLILDVSNPTNPTLLGSYAAPGEVSGLTLDGNNAFLATTYHGIHVLDISNPAQPTLIEQVAVAGTPRAMQKVGDILHIASSNAGYQRYRYNEPVYTTCLPLVRR